MCEDFELIGREYTVLRRECLQIHFNIVLRSMPKYLRVCLSPEFPVTKVM